MTTPVIDVGAIGKGVITNLAQGGEELLIANRTAAKAEALAAELGDNVIAVSVEEAIDRADTLILAIWSADQQQLLKDYGSKLAGKLIIDTSNPTGFDDEGQVFHTLDDGISSGQVNRDALADGVKFAKAFNSLAAESLAGAANKDPKVAIFYASDDESGEIDAEVERLISVAGFAPVKAGIIDDASLCIEVLGDLHPFGGLNGVNPTADTAQELLAE